MKYLFLLLFLCVWTGLELPAQSNHESQQKTISETSFNIVAPMVSDDGSWLTLRKRSWVPAYKNSDKDNDTIIIFDIRKPEKNNIVTYRTGIHNLTFVGNAILLLSDSLQTELYNLEKQTSIFYKYVEKAETLKRKNQFLLHYNEQENSRLDLYDNTGKLLNNLDYVYKYYTTKQSHIYAITEDGGNEFRIVFLNESQTKQLYKTSRKIEYLNIDPNEHGIMVFEQDSEGTSEEVVYLDLENKTTYPLKEVLPVTIQRGFTEAIHEGSMYFLKIFKKKEKQNDPIVDIWYGSDNKLEEKFYPSDNISAYAWEPSKRAFNQIGNSNLTTNSNIGNDRYFLSFNPYKFQDYTKEQASLLIYVYDLVQNRYSILDTIAPELYLSGTGEYALSPKDKVWYLYHIPSGSKKAIQAKDLGFPYFTNDGKAVLFEGEGVLWKYELKSGTLTKATEFKGFQASISNYEWESLSIPNRFSKYHVNLKEPLVIKLYDPQENLTSYVLWHKGKSEIIIQPTTRYIQYFKYNISYDCFSWVEEDYNMPPRLVFKVMGKKEQVLYQSNKVDKAILSLKQEIIDYTNRDSIPLNGILYYPLNYNQSIKYPMVVHIYEKQNHLANRYPHPSYYEGLGFNLRLFIDKGYFVYLPDIMIQRKDGPGMDALDCLNNALDALTSNQLIDKRKIGLIGHSFGGYETDFVATHSDRFAAYVSGSGHSDILWAYHSFNYNFLFPDYVRIEANKYKMGVPFTVNKDLYFNNNPIYYADKVNAPVLLWSGLDDQNVTSDHSMAFYNALRRNKKIVTTLFYKGEGHGLQNLLVQFDLTSKILDWFDYFLKGDTDIEWINTGLNKKFSE